MASTNTPFGRDDWNALVQQVNDLAQNPPSGCTAVSTLPEVGADHKWVAADITAMQDKLVEICKDNVFTPVSPGDKWLDSIVEELEAAIANGWCDCEECVPPCDNQGANEEIFIQSVTLTTCTEDSSFNCSSQSTASHSLWDEYVSLKETFQTSYREYCILVEEAEDLQTQKDAACAADPGGQQCADLTSDLNAKIAERDAKLAEADADKSALISKAAETVTNAQSAIHKTGATPFINLVSLNEPWTNWECDDPLRVPVCSGFDIDRCMVTWRLQRRTTEHIPRDTFTCAELPPKAGFPTSWSTILDGESTVDGGLVVKPFGGCRSVDTDLCFSNNCGGGSCQPCISSVSITHEYRLLVSPPFPQSAFTCGTFQSCTP